ncbi:MAG TPA: 30S ribosomal protein S17 [Anaerolineales bacterium]|nr:30S ribosomal protein S17 [Anaerolineales bacterium]
MSNQRRRMTGVVTRAKLTKTVTVRVDHTYRHPLYQKVVRRSRQYLVHDELGCQPGDRVQILESRPLSRRKRWAVETILRRATAAEVAASQQDIVDPVVTPAPSEEGAG